MGTPLYNVYGARIDSSTSDDAMTKLGGPLWATHTISITNQRVHVIYRVQFRVLILVGVTWLKLRPIITPSIGYYGVVRVRKFD